MRRATERQAGERATGLAGDEAEGVRLVGRDPVDPECGRGVSGDRRHREGRAADQARVRGRIAGGGEVLPAGDERDGDDRRERSPAVEPVQDVEGREPEQQPDREAGARGAFSATGRGRPGRVRDRAGRTSALASGCTRSGASVCSSVSGRSGSTASSTPTRPVRPLRRRAEADRAASPFAADGRAARLRGPPAPPAGRRRAATPRRRTRRGPQSAGQ